MKRALALASIILFSRIAYAQTTGVLTGVIESKSGAVENATIGVKELGIGSYTKEDGSFMIRTLPVGSHSITIRAIGFLEKEVPVQIQKGDTTFISVFLEESMLQMEEMVVTGTMKEMSIKDSPVKVNLISQNFLSKTGSNNIMDAIQYVNGLYTQVDCAVCGTSNIRINGMEGPYTSVLIDGMPLMGALASVYGLNGINPSVIRNLEVIKGPNSTLYGSQAMGGVINIITENPSLAPVFDIASTTSTHSEHNVDFSLVPRIGKTATMLSGSVYLQDRFIDENGDNFADITQNIRVSLFNKWDVYRPSGKKFSFAGKYYFEDRMGGTSAFDRELRGSNSVYGESIYTNRFELFGSYELPFEKESFRLDASYSHHDQDSYYGEYHYVADQQTAFANFIWDKPVSKNNGFVTGLSARYDVLNQLFNGMRLDGGSEDIRFVPAVFTQYDHRFSSKFRGLVGLRADHHQDHGMIFSPRFNLKGDPFSHSTVRLNVGTGFRIVNLFTEEHESLTGSRQVEVAEALNPERSFNVALNWNQIIDIGPSVLNVDFDLYHTRFSNQIIPDYDTPGKIIYTNLDGYSVSRGLAVSMAHNFIAPLTYTIGITFQDVFFVEDELKEDLPFSPDFNSVLSLTYRFTEARINVDYTGRIIGKMRLPEYPGRDLHSNPFSEHNLKITKLFSDRFEFFVSGKNLFNYIQQEPIIASDRPFSDDFATDYVYGPLQGRRFMAGISYKLK
ncbi:MAG: TonB-dependent receptor [Balneola sp.]